MFRLGLMLLCVLVELLLGDQGLWTAVSATRFVWRVGGRSLLPTLTVTTPPTPTGNSFADKTIESPPLLTSPSANPIAEYLDRSDVRETVGGDGRQNTASITPSILLSWFQQAHPLVRHFSATALYRFCLEILANVFPSSTGAQGETTIHPSGAHGEKTSDTAYKECFLTVDQFLGSVTHAKMARLQILYQLFRTDPSHPNAHPDAKEIVTFLLTRTQWTGAQRNALIYYAAVTQHYFTTCALHFCEIRDDELTLECKRGLFIRFPPFATENQDEFLEFSLLNEKLSRDETQNVASDTAKSLQEDVLQALDAGANIHALNHFGFVTIYGPDNGDISHSFLLCLVNYGLDANLYLNSDSLRSDLLSDHVALRVLLEAGLDPNDDVPGRLPWLFRACLNGHHRSAVLLMEYGANPNVQLTQMHISSGLPSSDLSSTDRLLSVGMTPLMVTHSRQVARGLLLKGANVNAIDAFGHSALYHCTKPHMVYFLLARGAKVLDIHWLTSTLLVLGTDQESIDDYLANQSKAVINQADEFGMTVLHEAFARGLSGLVRSLINVGADLNARNYEGNTPMMLAKEDMVLDPKALISAGMLPNLFNHHGATVLMICIESQFVHLVETLMKMGADLGDWRGSAGSLPVRSALRAGGPMNRTGSFSYHHQNSAPTYAYPHEDEESLPGSVRPPELPLSSSPTRFTRYRHRPKMVEPVRTTSLGLPTSDNAMFEQIQGGRLYASADDLLLTAGENEAMGHVMPALIETEGDDSHVGVEDAENGEVQQQDQIASSAGNESVDSAKAQRNADRGGWWKRMSISLRRFRRVSPSHRIPL